MVWHSPDVRFDLQEPNRNILTKETMAAEVADMERELSDCDSPIVFSHNDLNHSNIVITSDTVSGHVGCMTDKHCSLAP